MMNPVLSIGIYILIQILTLWNVHRLFAESGRMNGGMPAAAAAVLMVLYSLAAILPVAGAILPDSAWKFRIQAAGDIWLGFYLYAGGLFFILLAVTGIWKGRLSAAARRMPAGLVLVCIAAGICMTAYGMIHARHTKVKRYEIHMDKEAGDHKDLKLVLIADLHLGVNSHLKTIEKMVGLINAEEPDAVLIAGDVFTSSYEALKSPEAYASALREIKATYGVYAVYGNHDVEEGLFGGFPITPISQAFRSGEMEAFFADSGLQVLYDETVLIADGTVQITGRIDGEKAGDGTALRKSPSEVLKGTDPEKPLIVLQHEPVQFPELKENGADLALCGHTHAGQLFPGNLIVPFFFKNTRGFRVVSGLDTIVTSGIGYYGPPMRVATDSEISVVHIHFNAKG